MAFLILQAMLRMPKHLPAAQPKGVGYGGGSTDFGSIGMTDKATSEALKRQEEADAAMTQLLSQIRVCLSMVYSRLECLNDQQLMP